MWQSVVLNLIGGMGLLLYGMYIMSESLRKIAGNKLRLTLSTFTHRPLVGLLLGIIVTIIFQSSTATSVILVGLTNAGIVSLSQTIPITLGAGIGTSITAQLIALKVTEIALPIVGIGAAIIIFSKRERQKLVGQALIGFGMLFLGLKIMSDTMYPLRNDPHTANILVQLSDRPIMAVFIAAVITFLVHSSAATVGIIMVLSMQGMISIIPSIYLLLGTNIGTTFTALISSLGSTRESQRVATANFISRLVGVIIFLPFVNQLAAFVTWITPNSTAFQIANAHTTFNIVVALLFLPFTKQFANLLMYIVPEKEVKDDETKPKYLDETLLPAPPIAIGMAQKELLRITDKVTDMVKKCDLMFKKYQPETVEEVLKREDEVDQLSKAANLYLAKIMRQNLTHAEIKHCLGLANIMKDYEQVGDVIEKNITYLAESKCANNSDFSAEGHREITAMFNKVVKLLQVVNTAVVSNSCYLTDRAKKLYEEIIDMEFRLQMSHFIRMQRGGKDIENTSSIFLDLINSYLRISEHLNNIILVLTDKTAANWNVEDGLTNQVNSQTGQI